MSNEMEVLAPGELTPEEIEIENQLDNFPAEVQLLFEANHSRQALSILSQFAEYFIGIAEAEAQAQAIEVTDSSQLREMQQARELRLKLREHRVNASHKHKELKGPITANGKMIDAFKNIIEGLTKPLEAELQEKEDYAKNEEAKRVKKLNDERLEILKPYDSNADFLDLAALSQKDFDSLLEESKEAHEQAKAEAQRIAKEEKEKAEREEKLIKENKELRKQIQATNEDLAELPSRHLESITDLFEQAIENWDPLDDVDLREYCEQYAALVQKTLKAS